MRAAVYKGVRDVRVEDVPVPESGTDGIVLEVEVCGICGTDLHTFTEGAFVAPGQIMGHEFAGTVVEVGQNVTGVAVGDRVTSHPLVPCRACARCKEGRFNLCVVVFTQGIAFGRPGAFAERVQIPEAEVGRNVFPIGDLSAEVGATAEPLAVGVHAVSLAGDVTGQTALVLGLGTIGLQTVQALKARGAGRILGIDLSALRIEAAASLGAEALDGAGGVAETLGAALGEGEEIDVVFECSGIPELTVAAIEHVRSGGAVVIVALYDDPMTLDPSLLVAKELRVQGSIAYTSEDFEEAVELLRSGRAQAEPLITHREALDDIGEAFETQLSKADSIKVVVSP